jgi:predicted dehydrogenase
MRLLWRGSWIDTPGYEVPESGVLLIVDAVVPILKLSNASGRKTRRPQLKVATFMLTDGPARTMRKVRTKREEPRYTGDFHVAVALGHEPGDSRLIVALGCRVPPAAQQFVVHKQLVRAVAGGFAAQDLQNVATQLAIDLDSLDELGRQSYLYSGMEPPAELQKLLEQALASASEARSGRATAAPTPYGTVKPPKGPDTAASPVFRLAHVSPPLGTPAAVLGAGDYARTEVIPALVGAGFACYAVANREPQIAAMVGREKGFVVACTDSERAIAELPGPGLVVVATAHDSHAHLACLAADAGHRVFLEKPPTVTPTDVHRLADAMSRHEGRIEIGFNRRYHPLVRRAARRLGNEGGPTSITCVVKELSLQPDHWYLWPNQGTRITGNLCHWIDLAVFLMGAEALPVSLTLSPKLPGEHHAMDEERVLTVTFDDGSLLTVLATSRGDDIRGVQEQIEVRRGTVTVTIDDLWRMRVRSEGIDRSTRTAFRDKGHATMYAEALARVRKGEAATYPLRDMILVSAIQIAASDMARADNVIGEPPAWMSELLARTGAAPA